MDRKRFFAELRKVNSGVFGKSLSQGQVVGITRLLDVWARWYGHIPITWLANCLGQAYHETGGRMQPVLETYAPNARIAAARLENAYVRGQLPWVTKRYWLPDVSGQIGVGRGDIQSTHRANYVKQDAMLLKRFGVRTGQADDYDRALHQVISAHNMFAGMINGIFTGKSLGQYEKADGSLDHYNARDIVNGDKRKIFPGTKKHTGTVIAGYCMAFEKALRAAGADKDFGPPENPVDWPDFVTGAQRVPDRPGGPVITDANEPQDATDPSSRPDTPTAPEKRASGKLWLFLMAIAAGAIWYFTKG